MMSRREVLGSLGILGGWLFADHLLRLRRIEAITGTAFPEGLHPGFIEQDIHVPFFTAEEGQGPWLGEAVKNPVVRDVCRSVITEMDTNGAYTSIGHAFSFALGASAEALIDRYTTASRDLLTSESCHVAVISSAAVFSHFIDYADLGFDTRKWGGSDDLSVQRWGETGIGKKGFPSLLRAVNSKAEKEVEGKDRTMHFFNHMLLAYMLPYSEQYGGTAHLTTPPILSLFSDHLTTLAPEQAALVFPWLAGVGYEISTTELGHIGERRRGESVEVGLWDREVGYDFAANRLGAIVGFLLFQGNLSKAVEIMYDPMLIGQTDNPQFVLASVLATHEI